MACLPYPKASSASSASYVPSPPDLLISLIRPGLRLPRARRCSRGCLCRDHSSRRFRAGDYILLHKSGWGRSYGISLFRAIYRTCCV